MKGYIQYFTESGDYRNPYSDEFERVKSKKQAAQFAAAWFDEVSQCSDDPAYVLFFSGEPEGLYPCDAYPDHVIARGKRGGVVWSK